MMNRSTVGGYEDAFSVRIWEPDGVPRRIVVRHRGRFDRVAIVLEEIRDGIMGRLMRYDDAHGRFHRHEPGWPEPLPTIAAFLDAVTARERAAVAILEVKARSTFWEADVFGEKGAELK